MRTALAALAATALSACASAQDIPAHTEIRLPEGADGPVPAAVMISGCGGVQAVQDTYAETALENGWAAVIVDSHAARGIGRAGALSFVCTGLSLRGQERAADVFAALDLVAANDRLDETEVVLIGWSHGGWTILDAMAEAAKPGSEREFAGVQSAFLLYPYCGGIIAADRDPIGDPFPVTMLLAGRDVIAPPGDCRKLAERRSAEGSRIDIVEEPGLTHAFDSDTHRFDPRMAYDPEGEARALARFAAMLAEAD
ncbi:MAG: dienelactone hydrolase family protein [Oceanicaulis sp.]